MTGAYLRTKRGDKWLNIEVEHLIPEERQETFRDRSAPELLRWLDLVCKRLVEAEQVLDGLVADGILSKQ